MTEQEANRATVARLLGILGGIYPIEAGAEFIARDVVANFDGWRFEGINMWANWIQYLRTRTRVSNLTLAVHDIVANPDGTITGRGRWNALRGGRPVVSNLGVVRYRFEHGKIVEIWTTRTNYLLVLGGHMRFRAGLAAELLRVSRWKSRAPQYDLLPHATPPAAPRPRTVFAELAAQVE